MRVCLFACPVPEVLNPVSPAVVVPNVVVTGVNEVPVVALALIWRPYIRIETPEPAGFQSRPAPLAAAAMVITWVVPP